MTSSRQTRLQKYSFFRFRKKELKNFSLFVFSTLKIPNFAAAKNNHNSLQQCQEN